MSRRSQLPFAPGPAAQFSYKDFPHKLVRGFGGLDALCPAIAVETAAFYDGQIVLVAAVRIHIAFDTVYFSFAGTLSATVVGDRVSTMFFALRYPKRVVAYDFL